MAGATYADGDFNGEGQFGLGLDLAG